MEAAIKKTRANEHENQKQYLPTLGDGVTLRGNGRKRGVIREVLPDGRAVVDWFDRHEIKFDSISAVKQTGLEYCPTPKQIETATAAIRRGWSPSERAKRNCYRQPAEVKQIASGPLNNSTEGKKARFVFKAVDVHYK